MIAEAQTPFEWVTTHIQLVGWGTVLLVGYKAVRLISNIQRRIDEDQQKFDDIHLQATNHIPTLLTKLVDLSERNDHRMENWMVSKAAQKSE